ncbi:Histone chaperone ASF1-like [Trinorchestia longiramus]|nr:Histone chaperone ASF1-like [Trinorchestia longiramus]
MAKVHVVNVSVLENPSTFLSKFQFEITFECVEDLQEDLEWKIIYVGSAESEEYDQVLDTVYVGPVPEGRHLFVFEADPADASKIPPSELVGVTVVLVTCSYKGQEFVRVGYYVNNAYSDPEMQENPPEVPKLDAVTRNILASQPRVTKFKIDWDDAKETENIPPCNDNAPLDGTLNTTATTASNSSSSIIDPIKSTLLESSNSASAMEVA